MGLFSTLFLIILSLSMVMTAILLINALKNNYQTGQLVRKQVLQQIEQLRIGEMLKRHNVNTSTYLHKVPLVEIESEIRVCESCTKNVECNRILQAEKTEHMDLGFCPNSKTIMQQQAIC